MKQALLVLLLGASFHVMAAGGETVSPVPVVPFGIKTFDEVSRALSDNFGAKDMLHGSHGGIGEHETSPVPEPDSYMLLAAGLAFIGLALHRRGK